MSARERWFGAVLLLGVDGCGAGAAVPVVEGLCPAHEAQSAASRELQPRAAASLDLAGLMEAADLDGDGQSEVVMVDPARDRVHVTRISRSKQGVFRGDMTSHDVGRRPLGVAVGDVDADGCTDIVTANFEDDDISVLSCPAAPDGGSQRRIAVGAGPRAVEVVDLDADGAVEVVVAGALDGSLSALSLEGAEVRVWDPLCGSPGTTAIAVRAGADFTQLWQVNTELDLLTAATPVGGRGFVAGAASRTARSPAQALVVDVDGVDGVDDLVIRGLFGDVVVHSGGSPGGLGDGSPWSEVSPSLAVLGLESGGEGPGPILNLTARHGLVAARGGRSVMQVSGAPAPAQGRLYHLLALALATDLGIEGMIGRVDDSGAVSLLRADPRSSSFGSSGAVTWLEQSTAVQVIADFDGDGLDDLLVATGPGEAGVRLGGALEADAIALPMAVAGESVGLVAGSFDGDAHLDLAFISYEGDALVTLRGVGDGSFTVAGSTPIAEYAYTMVAGDISGDGLDDIVLTASSPVPERRVAYLADGDLGFVPEAVILPGSGGKPFIRDVDGSGRLDLVFHGYLPTSNLEVIIATGADDFVMRERVKQGQLGGGPEVVDLDGDGVLDLIGCGSPSADPFDASPDGLLVFPGGEGGIFGEVVAVGVGDTEIPGAPVGEAVRRFRCDGLHVTAMPAVTAAPAAITVLLYGALEYASGQRYLAALTFAGGRGEGPASYVRGELLPRLTGVDTKHGDFTGDGVVDLVGDDLQGAMVLLEGRSSVTYAPFGSLTLLPPGVEPAR